MTTRTTELFQQLVDQGQPVGEVVAVDKFFVKVKGLQPINVHALVLFEDGTQGFVRSVNRNNVYIFSMGEKAPHVGTVAVRYSPQLSTAVGESLIGRVVSPTGVPLDGKGPLRATDSWPIFQSAPAIHERESLDDLLETGITMVDSLFPIVKGQRMAVIGDIKTGKTALTTQLGLHQTGKDMIVIYTMISKRQSEIDALVAMLEARGAMDHSIVVASTIFDSLVTSYLAPYVACAIGEYLWQAKDRDVTVIYDDLTSHAQIYREMSLVSGGSPGRDSYPSDIFYIHSSLLERAGKLHRNHKTLTALPVVLAAGGDVTAYMPTNIISITDGQWILDSEVFKDGLRPAVSTTLSVTRVGGRGHTSSQQHVAGRVLRAMTAYRQALEFSHFGAELSDATRGELRVGALIKSICTQLPSESLPIIAQQLLLDLALSSKPSHDFSDIKRLKDEAVKAAKTISQTHDYEAVRSQFFSAQGVKGA